MTKAHQSRYPDPAAGFARAASDAPVLLNGMRVEFSERVPLYPVDLDHVAAGAAPGRDGDGRQ
jgi:hypothetical protein